MNIMTVWVIALILLKVPKLVPLILLIAFFLPVIFQIVAGQKVLREKVVMKFWIVCTMSIVGQILATISVLLLMAHNVKMSGSKDGLGFIFVQWLGILMVVIILMTIGTQLIINRKKEK